MSVVRGLYAIVGLCGIGGGCLMWGHVRQGRSLTWAVLGTVLLSLYGVVAALQPIGVYGRVMRPTAASSSPSRWRRAVLVYGFRSDKYDVLGALLGVCGVLVMVVPSRV